MAQIFYHDKKDPNFKKSKILKTKKQTIYIKLLIGLLSLSMLLNIFLVFHHHKI